MKIIATEKVILGIAPDDLKPYLLEESKKVWELHKSGYIREIYFTENRDAVLILECADKEEAMAILKELPLVKNNLIEFLVNELHPYEGYERLFG
ncbi:MAG: superoxide dismutase [Ignavibacteria bacterium]|nr:superoxide dismutase [Ignavibacteria bacterium]